MHSSSDITVILHRISSGDGDAVEELLPLVYDELRNQAAQQMARERVDHTLQATALVHDAYVRILGTETPKNWQSQRHFFTAAANAMRRILIEHARGKARLKRGGDRLQVEVSDYADYRQERRLSPEELLQLDEALTKLEATDQQVAELVRLRIYAGLSVTEAAKVLELSRTIAYERWDYAMSWFALELADPHSPESR